VLVVGIEPTLGEL